MNDEKAPNVNEAAGGASGLSAGLDRCQPPPRDGWFVKYGASLGGGGLKSNPYPPHHFFKT